jgi:hypothetical protein
LSFLHQHFNEITRSLQKRKKKKKERSYKRTKRGVGSPTTNQIERNNVEIGNRNQKMGL